MVWGILNHMSHLFVAEAAERLNFEGHLSEVLLGILANAGKPNGDGCHGSHGCRGSRIRNGLLWAYVKLMNPPCSVKTR
jgi:hypothetical protein